MYVLTQWERNEVLKRFPNAIISRSKHKRYLVSRDSQPEGRCLLELRGIDPPPSRREQYRRFMDADN